MKFGLFSLMPQRDPRKSPKQIASEAIEQSQMAEQLEAVRGAHDCHVAVNRGSLPKKLAIRGR